MTNDEHGERIEIALMGIGVNPALRDKALLSLAHFLRRADESARRISTLERMLDERIERGEMRMAS